MSEVKRYSAQPFSPSGLMFENEFGHYILFCEYEKLKAENAELNQRLENMIMVNAEEAWTIGKANFARNEAEQQLKKLTRQRDTLKKALEFYADRENWRNPNPIIFSDNRSMGHDLSYENPDDENCHKQHGGKTARKALQEAEQIK